MQRPVLAMLLAALTACASSSGGFPEYAVVRTGTDLPERFDPPAGFGRIQPGDTTPGSACLSPMRDPRDGTELRMTRAANNRADYTVPPGRYGVGAKEQLRLDCNTGQPLGIVPGP
jgi:hypothetical protein